MKWASADDSDSLLVGTKSSAGCFLELWGLVEKSTPIHKLFQNANKMEVFKTVVSIPKDLKSQTNARMIEGEKYR